MGSFGGFYKGEKKKPKKGQEGKKFTATATSTFTLPEIVSKKKKES